ncbi:MAG: DUF1820 family protein [Wenzhouxiangellaceae bacterium]|nr:DUF1820 family protein [Wenzhouxiangellaceae bacterium]MBS3746197.1 DUF1820 family protein [Wenzhouxiangellaceae bacterium]
MHNGAESTRRNRIDGMYKLVFLNQGKVYEIYSERVDSSHLYGFIEAARLVFETGARVVVDPTEERLRAEFADTEKLLLPLQSVIRIEQVNKRGKCAIRDRSSGEKVTPLPLDGPGRKS